MMMVIHPKDLKRIIKAAENSRGEICGFLFGHRDGERIEVKEVRFVPNRLSGDAFEMEPLEMVRAIDDAEKRGLEVVGIFHSHLKCPPRPSGRDLGGMRLWPVVWLIVTSKGEVRAWILKEGKVEAVEVEDEVDSVRGDIEELAKSVRRGMFNGGGTGKELEELRIEAHAQRELD
ncbi:M67 family metallopeptidase [Thermococcus sp. MAR1]|uniref:M67 family metallopeptidase n=1 Tax=Thermococcus sp. MAR1 TaxID=1638263 RepID=UPI00143A2610|nr:M67 family peptidase [Thermococcus sp. MAR1]